MVAAEVSTAEVKRGAADAVDSVEPDAKRHVPPKSDGDKEIAFDQLNVEQRKWAEAALKGENLFITGEAGTGKSFLLTYIIQQLRRTNVVAVTATTGIAAANLGGTTIHSFAGIGLGKDPQEEIVGRVFGSSEAVKRWRDTDVLLLDEISMMDKDLFTLLEVVARRVRGKEKSFGGLQVLVCGDFLQLPPVDSQGFAFESPAWKAAGLQTAELQIPQRQKGDNKFLSMLSEVRVGICSPLTVKSLDACNATRKAIPSDGIAPTRLYCMNRDVESENNARLEELDAPVEKVVAEDVWKEHCREKDKVRLLDLLEKQAPAVLHLKVGAQVLVTKNLHDLGLVNGSRGVIDGWGAKTKHGFQCPVVRFDHGAVMTLEPERFRQSASGSGEIVRLQLPLRLGWALTVHRAQGCTLTRAELQLQDAFDFGQAYVALSRVKSLDGLWIKGKPVTQKEVRANHKVLNFYFNK